MFTAEAEEELLSGKPDYVLDAIDDIETKVLHLIRTPSASFLVSAMCLLQACKCITIGHYASIAPVRIVKRACCEGDHV